MNYICGSSRLFSLSSISEKRLKGCLSERIPGEWSDQDSVSPHPRHGPLGYNNGAGKTAYLITPPTTTQSLSVEVGLISLYLSSIIYHFRFESRDSRKPSWGDEQLIWSLWVPVLFNTTRYASNNYMYNGHSYIKLEMIILSLEWYCLRSL